MQEKNMGHTCPFGCSRVNFNWSTLSGTGKMPTPENSVGPMCDLEEWPKIKRMTLYG